MNVTDLTYGGCDNELLWATFVECVVTGEGKIDKKAIDYAIYVCKESYMYENMSFNAMVASYEKFEGRFVDYRTLNRTNIIDLPVTTNMTIYDGEMSYLNDYYYNVIKSTTFAEIMYGMWIGLFLVVGCYNLLRSIAPKFYYNYLQLNWFRQHIFLPALAGTRHHRAIPFLGFVPLRSEFLIISIHMIYNLLVCSVHYTPHYPNYFSISPKLLVEIYISHRTGILSFAHMPLLMIFASRNNFLSAVTGWSFSTFNFYHKWLGRLAFVHASIHAIMWSLDYGAQLPLAYTSPYIRWGAVATIAGALIVILAWYPIRRYYYEVFKYVHIVLAIFFIVGSWYHVVLVELGYQQWLIVAFALWAFDRALRIARIFVNGCRKDATVEIVDEDVFRISIDYKTPTNIYPGSYIYIHFLLPTVFYQSHPFTAYPEYGGSSKIVVVGKVQAGMTRTIERAVTRAGGSMKLKVLLDGPYGESKNLNRFDSVLLIAGGVGITGLLSVVLPLLKSAKSVRISVIWAVREQSALKWISPEIQYLCSNKNLDFNIYISGSLPEESKVESAESINEKDSIEIPNITRSRPNITEEIAKFVRSSDGSVAVFCCGPAAMNDEARAATSINLSACNGKVEYIEDVFSW
ncbi:ferric reductase NAD binding domain-containing protein [Dipodascopsis uninucleata]